MPVQSGSSAQRLSHTPSAAHEKISEELSLGSLAQAVASQPAVAARTEILKARRVMAKPR
jgi:hypothetical protein